MPPMYYSRLDTSGHSGDIGQRPKDATHFHIGRQDSHNASIFPIHPPPPPSIDDYGEISLEEEVDHLLILIVTLLPLLLLASIIAGVAILIRRMKKDRVNRLAVSTTGGTTTDQSFSSLPTPLALPWWRDGSGSLNGSTRSHSVSMPHLHVTSSSTNSLSFLAIETYYNYPSTTSIMDETFQDVVDQAKIQAEVAHELKSHHESTTVPPKPLKRSLSLKSLRRIRRQIWKLFRKRRTTSTSEPTIPNTFNLSALPVETRQQLKEIYVY